MKTFLGKITSGVVLPHRIHKEDMRRLQGREVEFKLVSSARTAQQNRYMWLVYGLISIHTGFTPEECHTVFKTRFLSYKKKGFEFTRSTADLDKLEFGEYLDKVINYAQGELGIVIPEPEYT